ncbi:MAG: alpha/beta fold hydrolase [Gammaproteobacteria bacterium]
MRAPIPSLFVASMLACAYGCGTPAGDSAAASAGLVLVDCTLRGASGITAVQAECGRLSVAENPAEPDGRRIELFVARVRALSLEPPDDALTVIAGGPGQASTELYADFAAAFDYIRRERDIVLVDQRGTGRSNALECPSPPELESEEVTPEMMQAATRECLLGLPGDPRFYTTSVAVMDLDRVREAFGYSQLDVYGVSYGTRVAQHYLRRFPDRTRSVILDGVVPMDTALGPEISLDAQAALETMFERCAAEPVCGETFPDLETAFAGIRERLEHGPVPVEVADPATALPRQTDFSVQDMAIAVRLLSYTTESVSFLPLLLDHTFHQQDYAPLAAQALMVTGQLAHALSYGMHNAVVCTEDVPFYDPADIDRAALDATYLGATPLDALREICELWPSGVIDEGFKAPLESVAPVLLLSGTADPVTPPANARRVARHLEHAIAIEAQGQGHGIASRGCLPRLMAEFVSAASVDGLDTACVDRMQPAPFFTSFTGPPP